MSKKKDPKSKAPKWLEALRKVREADKQFEAHKAAKAKATVKRIQTAQKKSIARAHDPIPGFDHSRLEKAWDQIAGLFPQELYRASKEDNAFRCTNYWLRCNGRLIAIQITSDPEKPLDRARKTLSGMSSLRPKPDIRALVVMPVPDNEGPILKAIKAMAKLSPSECLVTFNYYTGNTYFLTLE